MRLPKIKCLFSLHNWYCFYTKKYSAKMGGKVY